MIKGFQIQKLLFVLLAFMVVCISEINGAVLRVDCSSNTSDKVYSSIQDAIMDAIDGDTVVVEPGICDENINFQGRRILVTSRSGPEATFITGKTALPLRRVVFETGEDTTSILRGFTIAGSGASGGGILIKDSSPKIVENVITDNRASSGAGILVINGFPVIAENTLTANEADSAGTKGGGIYLSGGGGVIKDNIISLNTAYESGGGIYAEATQLGVLILGNELLGNRAEWYYGGGIGIRFCKGVAIKDNYIYGNYAQDTGGGLFVSSSKEVEVNDNIIEKNRIIDFFGGGAALIKSGFKMTGNMIKGNTAGLFSYFIAGGGVYIGYCKGDSVRGNLIIENVIGEYGLGGAGVHCNMDTSLVFLNNTVTGNIYKWVRGMNGFVESAGIHFEAVTGELKNNIVTSNIGGCGIYAGSSSRLNLFYNDVWGNELGELSGVKPGVGYVSKDPVFNCIAWDDYRLLWGSPCIDSGDPRLIDPDGTRSDMGAYSINRSYPCCVYLTSNETVLYPGSNFEIYCTIVNTKPYMIRDTLYTEIQYKSGTIFENQQFYSIPGYTNIRIIEKIKIPQNSKQGTYTILARFGTNAVDSLVILIENKKES